jgi:hypothetical protein
MTATRCTCGCGPGVDPHGKHEPHCGDDRLPVGQLAKEVIEYLYCRETARGETPKPLQDIRALLAERDALKAALRGLTIAAEMAGVEGDDLDRARAQFASEAAS